MANAPTSGDFLDVQRVADALGDLTGLHVADFGCGSGFFTLLFAQRTGPSGVVTAVDVQEQPLENVAARARAANLGNVRTVRADLEVLGGTKIADASQDLVFVANVLSQSDKKEAILQETARVLRPDGRLYAVEWLRGAGGLGPPDERRTTAEELARLVVPLGFREEARPPAGAYHVALLFRK